ncbi:MAG TPA: sigma-70 family RNA polymerase sigma factor [Terriglobia bacterium]|nr:sigma-70 family RNA polymerase sigma factor [Terriglobia bacterium]
MFFRKKAEYSDFEAVALPHLNDLYRTAVHLVRDRTEAHDLVQEAYLNAWKAFDRFEPGTNCRAWLFKILINEVRHYRRRWFTSKVVPAGEQSFEETLTFEPPIPESIQDEDVLAALDEIPREFREIVLLADVQEFAYKEIADMLGIPVGTVMSRLSRGRKQLRVKLADYASAAGIGRKLEEGA